jgi:hypothetical protein
MVSRRAFVATALASLAAAAPLGTSAWVDTSAGGPNRYSEDGRLALDAVDVLVATLPRVRTVWKPPAAFSPLVPFAYYAGRGGDAAKPNDPAIWLNPDHPELVSPRLSRLTDEIPLFTELLLASADVRVPGTPSLGLYALPADDRRVAARALAARVAVVTRYTAFPAVDDAEFARRAFAFAVLRQMTPEIGGVEILPPPAARLPDGEAAVYAGRDADRRAPRGWGVVYADLEAVARDRAGFESWVRAYVLATADRQPPGSEVRSAYEAARAKDAAAGSGRWAARRAFAAAYVDQVAALFGKEAQVSRGAAAESEGDELFGR